MEVHDDYLAGHLLQQGIGLAKGIVVILHENTALEIDHRVALVLPGRTFVDSHSRDALRVIGGTQYSPCPSTGIAIHRVEVVDDLALVPDVIARSEHFAAKVEQ